MFLAMVHILDYAVMKYVTDCPLLVKQEHLHAKMHHQGQKNMKTEGDRLGRFWLLGKLFDIILLRLGRTVGVSVAAGVEATAGHLIYYASSAPFVKDCESDVCLFHFLEELEHGLLTVQSIKKQSHFIVRLLLFPIMCILWCVSCLSPIITAFVVDPIIIFKPTTYVQLVKYIGTLGFAWMASEWAMVSLWLVPYALDNYKEHEKKYAYYVARWDARKIPYEIVDQASYDLYTCEY